MTLAQKLARSAWHREYYQRNAERIRERKRNYMAERRHRKAIAAAIESARKLLNVSPVATKPRSEACV